MVNLFAIILAFALALLNAFFVAAEFGMVKLRHTRVEAIKKTQGVKGRILSEIHKELDVYLSACQLGITLASLGLGWVGEPAFAKALAPVFNSFDIISERLASFLAFFFAFSFLSFLHIVVGELMPKSLAIRQAERVSLWTAVPLYIFYWIMFPAIWVLNACSLYLLKKTGLDEQHKGDLIYSPEEIKIIFSASHLHGDLTKEELDILEHTLDLADLEASDVMRPIDEMVLLTNDKSIDELLKVISETRYSRYPILDVESDEIIGLLHVKDLIPFLAQRKELHLFSEVSHIIRPIYKAKENDPALDLLRKFREGMPHFSIVYGDAQKPIGFVTLDNLLQVLVGRIKDEFHRTKVDWIALPDGGFLMPGNCSIYAIEQALDIQFETKTDISTLNGLVFHQLEAVPKVGDRIEFKKFYVIIDQMKGPMILKARVYKKTF